MHSLCHAVLRFAIVPNKTVEKHVSGILIRPVSFSAQKALPINSFQLNPRHGGRRASCPFLADTPESHGRFSRYRALLRITSTASFVLPRRVKRLRALLLRLANAGSTMAICLLKIERPSRVSNLRFILSMYEPLSFSVRLRKLVWFRLCRDI